MAYKKVQEIFLINWDTGDPEGDRRYLFEAYREFLAEIRAINIPEVDAVFRKWKIQFLDVDNFPRIGIERP